MHGEAPELKRCCFCLPLRRGLIAWGYAKLALNLFTIAFVVAMILYSNRHMRSRGFDARDIAILIVIITSLLIDLSFGMIFIMASHKKSVKWLNVSYVYNMVWLGLVLLGSCYHLYVSLCYVNNWWGSQQMQARIYEYLVLNFIFSAALAFSLIFVQIYLVLLIRSEMAKLRKQSLEMQFSNHLVSGEPQCTLHNATEPHQGEGKIQPVQDDCTLHKATEADQWEGKKLVMQGQDASH